MANHPSLQSHRESLKLYTQCFSAARTQAAHTLVVDECTGGTGEARITPIRGKVRGGATQHDVVLSRGQNSWNALCTCSAHYNCAHAYALATHWLETTGTAPAASANPTATPPPPNPPKPAKPQTFAQLWQLQLAEKIDRPLNPEETKLLQSLDTVFKELQARGGVYKSTLQKLGLDAGGSGNTSLYYYNYDFAFKDYWPRNSPPASPWALWQYLAYDWQNSQRAIPEAFLPVTDTRAIRAEQNQRALESELHLWRSTLSSNAAFTPISSAPVERPIEAELTKATDFRVQITPSAKAELHAFYKPTKSNPASWRACTQKWLKALDQAGPTDFAHLPQPARTLVLALRLRPRGAYGSHHDLRSPLDPSLLDFVLADPACHPAIVLPDGTPYRIQPDALQLAAVTDPNDPDRLRIGFTLPDQTPLTGTPPLLNNTSPPLYLWDNRIWPGPPAPPTYRLPVAALKDPAIASGLRAARIRVPEDLTPRFKSIPLRPLLRAWLEDNYSQQPVLRVRLFARAESPPVSQEWQGFNGWRWLDNAAPPPPRPDEPHLEFDLSAANAVGAHFAAFRLEWWESAEAWNRPVHRTFPEDFVAWHAQLPADLELEVAPELRGLLGAPLRARLSVDIAPAEGSGVDWFDLSVALQPEDTTLTPEEIQLLVKARGAWVRLPKRGWQRLALDEAVTPGASAALDRLGLTADSETLSGKRSTHRFHALQLADAPVNDEALAARLRTRAAELRAIPPPPLPAGLQAELRPYQLEGYHFLTHLSAQGLGGVLADDMGLGKTLQTLAWLLWLAETQATASPERPFRALVVAPKSVVPNWAIEAARFAPALTTARLAPGLPPPPGARVLVVNYTQLRLRAAELAAVAWDAVILDEGQNIKNPGSATARAARDLPARHRLVLTGTPIENRLLDLWSLLAFAQPGLLGPQAVFQRLYNDKEDPEGARSRLATRVRPFLLRRTKGQVARDLPARIEEEISCELEGPQRALYDAELKKTRQLLLKVETSRQFDAARFNILQSLLRLRQICCDPRLVGLDDSAPSPGQKRRHPEKAKTASAAVTDASSTPDDDAPSLRPSSAKLDALFDTIEPLVAEGHRVLVFSQFVTMLELIREELLAREISHLLLTGQTENRQDLVNQFQAEGGPAVFLLSLKAAGSGLNLTAASYVVLFDPWWNPAVEAQAIDRTHRIGQKNTVIAYRLIAKDTIEEKIRALQREKSALADAVVQEESLAKVMDLESLRRILA
ncbi:MAG: DEAD/DEAH box helicase [Verrucomicrobia bacterium]|nr:DEAD/DEAH box helicase [Verrucomicrobiota bacterium]